MLPQNVVSTTFLRLPLLRRPFQHRVSGQLQVTFFTMVRKRFLCENDRTSVDPSLSEKGALVYWSGPGLLVWPWSTGLALALVYWSGPGPGLRAPPPQQKTLTHELLLAALHKTDGLFCPGPVGRRSACAELILFSSVFPPFALMVFSTLSG